MKHARVMRIIVLCLLLAPALTACAGNGATSGVKATLEPGSTAPLGGTIPFNLIVSYTRDVPSDDGPTKAEVVVSMDNGLSLADTLNWTIQNVDTGYVRYSRPITFKANVPQTFDFAVKLDGQGEHRLDAGAIVYMGESGRSPGFDILLLDVSSNGTNIHDMPLVQPTASNP